MYLFLYISFLLHITQTVQRNPGALFAHVQRVLKSHQQREAFLTAHTNQADIDFKYPDYHKSLEQPEGPSNATQNCTMQL